MRSESSATPKRVNRPPPSVSTPRSKSFTRICSIAPTTKGCGRSSPSWTDGDRRTTMTAYAMRKTCWARMWCSGWMGNSTSFTSAAPPKRSGQTIWPDATAQKAYALLPANIHRLRACIRPSKALGVRNLPGFHHFLQPRRLRVVRQKPRRQCTRVGTGRVRLYNSPQHVAGAR